METKDSVFNILFAGEDTFKRVKLSDMKIKTDKRDRELITHLNVGTKNEIRVNPFSGEEVELSPEAVAIYDLVKGAERTMHARPNDESVYDLFFSAKEIFVRNWPKEYSILLD